MRRFLFFLFFIFSIFSFGQEVEFSETEIVVEFNNSISGNLKELFTSNQDLEGLNMSLDFESFERIGNAKIGRTFLLKFKNPIDILNSLKLYQDLGLFRYVEPNFVGKGHGTMQVIPTDAFFASNQWSHVNDGTFSLSSAIVDADIDTDLAWGITQGDPNLIVAILDSGIKLDHPEFAGRIVAGYDYVNNDTNPSDDHGHGTNVAGIALATGNNGIGYAGVNWNSKIMPIKILNNFNTGLYTWWASGIYFAVDNGARVINLSAGGNSPSILLEDAINYATLNNVSVVVSNGNQNSSIQYPARYVNAIAVGCTNPDDVRTNSFFWSPGNSGSNFGPEIDLVAPGNFIFGLSHTSDINYQSYWGGTSQAAPHVAGVISLILSINPSLSVAQVRFILEDTAEDMVGDGFDTPGWDQYYGHGRLNAFLALSHNTLSFEELPQSPNSLQIFPNPIGENNDFRVLGIGHNKNFTVSLVALDGRLVFQEKQISTNGIINVQLQNLKTGIYVLNLIDSSGTSQYTTKLVKP
jgi:subtilisin family serine protease